ncbi:MAG TPA: hypothetical protein VLB50_13530, partial [Ignavibacteriaceae bacterium]|nr:hypothetical protein [Ignavibacteriaceae bacterium]
EGKDMLNKKIIIVIVFSLCDLAACSQISMEGTVNEKLMGKWSAVDSTSFRGKEIEFLPGNQVVLTIANGGQQQGQYEINDSTITFSIGDAPPFNTNFRFEGDNLILNAPGEKAETRYEKINE